MPKRSAQSNNGGPLQKKAKMNPQPGRSQRTANAESRAFAPVAQGLIRRQPAPKISQNGAERVIVRHCEYIADVAGSVAFAATAFPVNAGSSETFPWLATIARRFESYRFRHLRFRFESQSATTATGTVVLALDYDAADAAPVDKVSAMSYRNSVRCAPWESVTHISDGADLHKLPQNYVRGDIALPANLDVKTYDIGNLFVCTQGQASTTAIGELYVEYEVELITPQLSPADTPSFKGSSSTALAAATPFGTNFTNVAGSNIDISVNGAGTTMTFNQAFEGLVLLSYSGTTMVNQTAGGTATVSLLASVTGSGSSPSTYVYSVRASAGQTLAPSGGTFSAVTALVARAAAYSAVLA